MERLTKKELRALLESIKECYPNCDLKTFSQRVVSRLAVSAFLTTALKREGNECPWRKIGKGLYIWKMKATIAQPAEQIPSITEEPEDEEQYEVISSFCMFWRRKGIEWISSPKIL